MITRVARAGPDTPAPVVADVQESRLGGVVDERLVEPEAVAPIRRIPGVRARLAVPKAVRVEPARSLESRQPCVLSWTEHPGFLVDAGTARIGVAQDDRRAAAPAVEKRERCRVERVFPSGHAVGDV